MLQNLSGVTLTVAVLAVWRLTHLFWGEDGPAQLLARLRRAAGNGFWGGLLDCFYCLSLWFAAPLAWILSETWSERLLLWFGLSGAAILLERATSRSFPTSPPAIWREEPLPKNQTEEEDPKHVLLR